MINRLFVIHCSCLFSLCCLAITGCSPSGNSMQNYFQADNLYSDAKMRNVVTLIEQGDLAGIKAWVKAGGDIDKSGRYGVTPLYLSWLHRQKDIYDFLLEKGAIINLVLDVDLPPAEFLQSKIETGLVTGAALDEDIHYLRSALKYATSLETAQIALHAICSDCAKVTEEGEMPFQEQEKKLGLICSKRS